MICEKCGQKLNDDDIFCANCGAKVKATKETVKEKSNPRNGANDTKDIQQKTESNTKTFRLNKKALIITSIILLIAIVASAVGYFIWNNIPVEIDLSNYISNKVYNDSVRENFYGGQDYDDYDEYNYDDEYDYNSQIYTNYEIGAGINVYGYNEYASIYEPELYNVIDWNALENDVNNKLSKKKKINGRHITFSDIFQRDMFKISIDSFENLKNDDVVSVTIDDVSTTYNGIEIKFAGCSNQYTISDLKVVQVFNPFDYVTLTLYGANGHANAECVVDDELNEKIEGLDGVTVTYYDNSTISVEKDDYIISKISFYLDDNASSSRILKNGDVVTMYCNCSDELTETYNIFIANYQKNYNISTLGEYITKSTSISAEDLKNFQSYASKEISAKYGDDSYYSNFKFNCAYVADLKDKSSSSSYYNSLCLIYSYNYSYSDDKVETEYLYVNFTNLIVTKDGSIAFTPEGYFDNISMGYENVQDILDSTFSEEQNVSKIK